LDDCQTGLTSKRAFDSEHDPIVISRRFLLCSRALKALTLSGDMLMRSFWLPSLVLCAFFAASVAEARRPVTSDDAAKVPDPPKYGEKKGKREGKDFLEVLTADGHFNTFVKLVNDAGVLDTFTGPGPMTLFAPTDAAFKKLGKKALDGLTKDPEKLKAVLLYHVVAGKMSDADLTAMKSGTKLRTVGQGELTLSVKGKKVKVNNAAVTKADLDANNGFIHVVDTVLMPPPPPKPAKAPKKK